MTTRQHYRINPDFEQFVNTEVLPLTSLEQETFWDNFTQLIDDMMPINQDLLVKRDQLQAKINAWHLSHPQQTLDLRSYRQFLVDIGYIVDQGDDFTIETQNVDPEIATIAGPQLVVPLKNARFALNAANARWGSLYDALYGTDAIPRCTGLSTSGKYNRARGSRVIQYAKQFLDDVFPLREGSHRDATAYMVYYENLLVTFSDGSMSGLRDQHQFVGSNGSKSDPSSIILQHHNLHIEIMLDRNGTIGSQDLAGIDDIMMESAITSIMDCEDAIAAVDSEDKIETYRNWLGLMQGTLSSHFIKDGKAVCRQLHADRAFNHKQGHRDSLSGRSLMLIRNVGIHMDSHLITGQDDQAVPEGIIDAVITSMIAMTNDAESARRNSQHDSIYIVKPKLHGPEEVAFTNALFNRVEDLLGLERHTIKMGIMDEERRTSLNLKACIREAKQRVVFINTGFLDRTGDEIHTSIMAGAFLPKAEIKNEAWLSAYEKNNVAVGLACGFRGRAQIGKGMWAMPDEMARMMEDKIQHPRAGANTAWVPSPTAATLHAIHYHKVDVDAIQQQLWFQQQKEGEDYLNTILSIPLISEDRTLPENIIEAELKNNIQGILGYVVHWIQSGIGCSKIFDINNTGLMEDRATLRISSQHIANWLQHGICSRQHVDDILLSMSKLVDKQNQSQEGYRAMNPNPEESHAYQAARALIFEGANRANGYTESVLHRFRQKEKALGLGLGLGLSEAETQSITEARPPEASTRFLHLQAH